MMSSAYDLILADDGEQGWEAIASDSSIRLVFTDLVMPNLDGFELLERIRNADDARIRDLPVIIITDADAGKVKEKAYEMGATDFISKPFDATDLNARVSSILRVAAPSEGRDEQSDRDPVTRLLKKRAFFKQMGKDLATNSTSYQTMVVMYFEIDEFKEMFVQVGRAGAEVILQKVTRAITSEVRSEDTVGRVTLSGFAVSMPDAQLETAALIAERISKNVKNLRLKRKGEALPIYISIGSCVIDQGHKSEPEVILDLAKETRTQGMKETKVSSIYLREFVEKYLQKDQKTLSIDKVLNQIRTGILSGVDERMGLILSELKPIFTLMSDEHKERLINSLLED